MHIFPRITGPAMWCEATLAGNTSYMFLNKITLSNHEKFGRDRMIPITSLNHMSVPCSRAPRAYGSCVTCVDLYQSN